MLMAIQARLEISRNTFYILFIASSLFGLFAQHFGAALLVFIFAALNMLIILPYAIEHGKRHGKHIYARGASYEIIWLGALLGILAIAQYIGFFARHGISMQYITVGTPMQAKATALAYLTMVCCITLYIIQQTTKEKFIHRRIYRAHIWRAAALSLMCSAFLLYWPFVVVFSRTNSLSLGDWLLAFTAAALFAGIREFQHWDRQHHPKNIHALHKRI
jgi:Cation transporting ATPase, C-terminus